MTTPDRYDEEAAAALPCAVFWSCASGKTHLACCPAYYRLAVAHLLRETAQREFRAGLVAGGRRPDPAASVKVSEVP